MDTVEQLAVRKSVGLVWIDSPFPTLLLAALEEALKPRAHAHWDRKAPEEVPPVVIYYPPHEDSAEKRVRRLRRATPDAFIDKAEAPFVQQKVGGDYCGPPRAR